MNDPESPGDELETRLRQQSALAAMARAAVVRPPIDRFMADVTARLAAVLGLEVCEVLEVLPDGSRLVPRAGCGPKPGRRGGTRLDDDTASPCAHALRTNRPVIVDDLRTDPRFGERRTVRGLAVLGGIAVVIRGAERPFGVLAAYSTHPRLFTESEVRFVQSVADLLAAAILECSTGVPGTTTRELRAELVDLQKLSRMAAAGVALLDRDLRFVSINERLAAMNGASVAWHLGRTVEEMLPQLAALVVPWLRRVLDTGKPLLGLEIAGRTAADPDVDREWLASYLPVAGENGHPSGVSMLVLEVTELKHAERRLTTQYTATLALAESTTLREAARRILSAVCENHGWDLGALWVVERATILRCLETYAAVDAARDGFGATSRGRRVPPSMGLLGRAWATGQAAWTTDLAADARFEQASLGALIRLRTGFAFPVRLRGRVLGVLELFSRAHRPPDGALADMLTTVGGQIGHFIERSRAKEVARSRAQLRTLAARLEAVREEERSRLAREIHDQLGQALTGVSLDLTRLQSSCAGNLLRSQVDGLSEVQRGIGEAIRTVQRISTELRPPVLDDFGLAAAIEWQTAQLQRRTGIHCRTICDADGAIDPERSTVLFRICQEILTNVARHAKASAVSVTLHRRPHHLALMVKDNGRGIAEQAISSSRSLGLLGMRERAALVGGQVTIRGEAGKGTTVMVTVPMPDPPCGS